MAVTTTQVLPFGTYPPNTYSLGPANVPDGATAFAFSFTKGAGWQDPAIKLDIMMDISIDAGASWETFYGFTAEGGGLDKFGNPYTEATGGTSIPHPEIPNRKIRATLKVLGGPLQTSCSLTVS
jgi:hypothetical protein